MGIEKAFVQAVGLKLDFFGVSTLLQGASMPQPAVMPTTHPYITKTIAGDSAHANFTSGAFGVNANALLTATAAAGDIEDELFKHAEYLGALGVNIDECYTLMPLKYVANVYKAQGQRVSIGFTSAGSAQVHPTFSGANQAHGLMNPGFVAKTVKHEATGLTLIPYRFFPNFGNNISNAFSTAPSATLGGKYTPGSTITDTVFGINGILPTNSKAFELGQGANNPADWNNAAKNVKTLYNSVRMVTWHPRALRRGTLEAARVATEQFTTRMLGAWAIVMWATIGWGIRDPTAVCYSIETLP